MFGWSFEEVGRGCCERQGNPVVHPSTFSNTKHGQDIKIGHRLNSSQARRRLLLELRWAGWISFCEACFRLS